MKVKIGIVPALNKEGEANVLQKYIDYITIGGADAVLLPHPITAVSDEALKECDSFMLLGGADIDPDRYGEQPIAALGETIPVRDEYEFAIFKRIFDTGKPILAICRGMQLVNCALGGKLYQDLPTQTKTEISHRCADEKCASYHMASFKEGTYLHGVLGGEPFEVNSYHHQAIKLLGDGLAVMASAPDGTIEAVYHTGKRILWGFQWHPERLDNSVSRFIIEAFVSASGNAGTRREVTVKIDRPMGSKHPRCPDVIYELNYGFVPGVIGGDGEEQDAYVIGVTEPLYEFVGELIAVVHREDDNESKWIVAPKESCFTPDEIRTAVDFQEKYHNCFIEVIK